MRAAKARDAIALAPEARRLLEVASAIAARPGMSARELEALFSGDSGPYTTTARRATLAKCVATLKAYGVIEDRPQRSGYYLAGLGLSDRELAFALNGLEIQSEHLGCPVASATHESILDRLLRGRVKSDPTLTYPTVAVVTRVLPRREQRFEELMDVLWEAIRGGTPVELAVVAFPWGAGGPRTFRIWPLQFQFHDRAWYVLAEDMNDADRDFKVFRMDRLATTVRGLDAPPRKLVEQRQRLAEARQRQFLGWGVVVPSRRAADHPVPVRVRLDAYAAGFIDEARHEKRHPTQRIRPLESPTAAGELELALELPDDPWVLEEFRRWLIAWGAHAVVLEPVGLAQRVVADLRDALASYETG